MHTIRITFWGGKTVCLKGPLAECVNLGKAIIRFPGDYNNVTIWNENNIIVWEYPSKDE